MKRLKAKISTYSWFWTLMTMHKLQN